MTHFNFVPVNARLAAKSRLPGAAARPPTPPASRLPARPSAPGPIFVWVALVSAIGPHRGSVALQASPPCDGAFAGLVRPSRACFVSSFSTLLLPHHLL